MVTGADEVDLEHPVHGLLVHLGEGALLQDAGGDHHVVDPAGGLEGGLQRGLDVLGRSTWVPVVERLNGKTCAP